jgi:apolipoprotein N-acyltransferase
VFDAYGRLLGELPLGQAGTLDVTLPAALPATPYSRLGEGPFWFLVVAMAALSAFAAARFR